MNKITLYGRMGRDPELSEKMGDKGPFKTVSFSLAVDRQFGDGTDWFRCQMAGKRAEVIEKYFHKGSPIIVDGSMESYRPKNDPDHDHWSVKVREFYFCDSRNNEHEQRAPKQNQPDPGDSFENIDEDVPF